MKKKKRRLLWYVVLAVLICWALGIYRDLTWHGVSGELPEGLGKITLMQKGVFAPLFAEAHRKIEFDLPGREPRTVPLFMSLDAETCVQVFLIEQGEERFVRLVMHGVEEVISLDTMISEQDIIYHGRSKYPEGKFVGAFIRVIGFRRYVDVNKDRAAARKHFERHKCDFRNPLSSLNKLEKEEAGAD